MKLVFGETRADKLTVWAAAPRNPELRQSLFVIDRPTYRGVSVSLAHDGSKAAYTVFPRGAGRNLSDAELWVVDLGSGTRRLLAEQVDIGGWWNYPIWSPDDRQLAIQRLTGRETTLVCTLATIDVQTGEERVLVSTGQGNLVWPLGWSNEGRYFYYLNGWARCELWRADAAHGNALEFVRLVAEMGGPPRCYSLAPDTSAMACTILAGGEPTRYAAVIVPLGPGATQTLISGALSPDYNAMWHPEGKEVTVVVPPERDQPAELRNIGVGALNARTMARAQEGTLYPGGWSPDGRWFAVKHFSETGSTLLVVNAESGEVAPNPPGGGGFFIGWLAADVPRPAH